MGFAGMATAVDTTTTATIPVWFSSTGQSSDSSSTTALIQRCLSSHPSLSRLELVTGGNLQHVMQRIVEGDVDLILVAQCQIDILTN